MEIVGYISFLFAIQLCGIVMGQSCHSASEQLSNDPSCANAFGNVCSVFEGTRSGITRSDQLSFCTPRCISLVLRLLESCIDEVNACTTVYLHTIYMHVYSLG